MYLIEKLTGIESLFLTPYPYNINKVSWKSETSEN